MNFVSNSRKALLAGIALSACLGFAFNAQAQTCTTDNWFDVTPDSPTVGKQDGDNRRYGGPCGMRAPLDGTARYVSDDSPAGEESYIARFYVFVEGADTDPITLFAADDGTNDRIQVVYDNGSILLSVWDVTAGDWVDIPSSTGVSVGSGWHSVEFVWTQDGSANIILSVDGTDVSDTVDTSGITIANAHLGNLNADDSGGLVDFDDFDSRRMDRPGRLMRGDADENGAVDVDDAIAAIDEFMGRGFAPGQPDCNEDGLVDVDDFICAVDIFMGRE